MIFLIWVRTREESTSGVPGCNVAARLVDLCVLQVSAQQRRHGRLHEGKYEVAQRDGAGQPVLRHQAVEQIGPVVVRIAYTRTASSAWGRSRASSA